MKITLYNKILTDPAVYHNHAQFYTKIHYLLCVHYILSQFRLLFALLYQKPDLVDSLVCLDSPKIVSTHAILRNNHALSRLNITSSSCVTATETEPNPLLFSAKSL